MFFDSLFISEKCFPLKNPVKQRRIYSRSNTRPSSTLKVSVSLKIIGNSQSFLQSGNQGEKDICDTFFGLHYCFFDFFFLSYILIGMRVLK